MKQIIGWIWALVPEPAKVWVIIIGVVLIMTVLGFAVYKIQKWGYDRSEAKHESAALVSVDKKLDLKVKQDEIENAPIDNGVTMRRLRNHTF